MYDPHNAPSDAPVEDAGPGATIRLSLPSRTPADVLTRDQAIDLADEIQSVFPAAVVSYVMDGTDAWDIDHAALLLMDPRDLDRFVARVVNLRNGRLTEIATVCAARRAYAVCAADRDRR